MCDGSLCCLRLSSRSDGAEVEAGVKQQLKQMLLSTLPAPGMHPPVAGSSAAPRWRCSRHPGVPAMGAGSSCSAVGGAVHRQGGSIGAATAGVARAAAHPPGQHERQQDSGLKQATLATLGFVCEEVESLEEEVLSQEQVARCNGCDLADSAPATPLRQATAVLCLQVNSVLTAVVAGLRKDEQDAGVRLAAVNALQVRKAGVRETLPRGLAAAGQLTIGGRACRMHWSSRRANFENEQERNYLMQVVCEGAPWAHRRRACGRPPSSAWLALPACTTARLQPYIKDIFSLTQRAISSDEEIGGQAGHRVLVHHLRRGAGAGKTCAPACRQMRQLHRGQSAHASWSHSLQWPGALLQLPALTGSAIFADLTRYSSIQRLRLSGELSQRAPGLVRAVACRLHADRSSAWAATPHSAGEQLEPQASAWQALRAHAPGGLAGHAPDAAAAMTVSLLWQSSAVARRGKTAEAKRRLQDLFTRLPGSVQ